MTRPDRWEVAQAMAELYDIRPVEPDDVEAYVGCHVDCLAETYVDIMPPEFTRQHREQQAEEVVRTRAAWTADQHASGRRERSWLARDGNGGVVGIVRAGPGQQPWESALGAPPSPVHFQLQHLYTRRGVHGSGLGQQLLDTATGGQATYLWILHGNARADRFYRRNGFAPDGVTLSCGPSWFFRTMYRLVRPAPEAR